MNITMPQGVVLVVYVDDILFLAKTESDLEPAKNALILAFEDTKAGKFTFKVSEEALKTGLGFLRYHLYAGALGKLRTNVSKENARAFNGLKRSLGKRIAQLFKGGAEEVELALALAESWKERRSWVLAFRASDDYAERMEKEAKALEKSSNAYEVPLKAVMECLDKYLQFST